METHSGTMGASPGGPWSLIMAMDAHGALEAPPGALEVCPGALEANPGALEDHPGARRLTLAIGRLSLEPVGNLQPVLASKATF
jgi:hypothetical protein